MYTQTKHTHRTQHINYTINLQKVQKILNKNNDYTIFFIFLGYKIFATV